MADFDPYNLKTIHAREHAGEYVFSGELDNIPESRKPLLPRIVLAVLVSAVFLYLIYALVVHPVDTLKLRVAFAENCTLTVQASALPRHVYATVVIDGNVIAVTESLEYDKTVYYELEGDRVYLYDHYFYGGWKKIDLTQRYEAMDMEWEDNIEIGQILMDRNNYERADGKLFVWRLKDSFHIDGLENIQIQRRWGKIIITADVENYPDIHYKFTFDGFGVSKIERPWENAEE